LHAHLSISLYLSTWHCLFAVNFLTRGRLSSLTCLIRSSSLLHELRLPLQRCRPAMCYPRPITMTGNYFWVDSSVFGVLMRREVVWNRCFGTTYRFHLKGSSPSSWTAWPMKMERIGSPETSVQNHVTPRNNPEDGRIPFSRGGSLRSHKFLGDLTSHAWLDSVNNI
jgi:hypothetical protein